MVQMDYYSDNLTKMAQNWSKQWEETQLGHYEVIFGIINNSFVVLFFWAYTEPSFSHVLITFLIIGHNWQLYQLILYLLPIE